jgi:hypothetical protein
MVQELYRIQWKDAKGKWHYANGAIILKVMGPDFIPGYSSEAMKNVPYLFTEMVTAERVARAMSDHKDVVQVELREEKTCLTLIGAGREEANGKTGQTS